MKQRIHACKAIRSLLQQDNYVIVVEHDLAVLDYLSDYICVLYGTPGAYGVVTMPFSVSRGKRDLVQRQKRPTNTRILYGVVTMPFSVREGINTLANVLPMCC